ncbi:MAG: hypothetical protein QM785_19110 [Pyrinomonadaceae bacterium]
MLTEIENILKAEVAAKPALIRDLQQKVWNNSDVLVDARIDNVLRDLAYDLDFYEPNPMLREEDSSFYGDVQLDLLLETALDQCKLALDASS